MSHPTLTLAHPAARPARIGGRYSRGSFIRYELLTTDLDAAADFYAKVIGWGTRDSSFGPVGPRHS
jgi:hypothetical protein